MKLQKETSVRHGRWYDDACGTAFALELVGERWSLLIVRELMFGGRRFSDLRASLPGISAKILSERLDSFEVLGVVRREAHEALPGVQVYALTDWGKAADVAIMELGRWAARSSRHDPTLPLSPASLMLSFRTMFDAARARSKPIRATMTVSGEPFAITVADGTITIRRGRHDSPDFSFTAPVAPVIAAAIYGKAPLDALPDLAVTGDLAAAQAFIDCFELPPPLD